MVINLELCFSNWLAIYTSNTDFHRLAKRHACRTFKNWLDFKPVSYLRIFAILLLTQIYHLCVYDIESNYLKHIFHFTMLRLIVLIFQKLPISKESNFFDTNPVVYILCANYAQLYLY